jgi:5'(3')-deoxyribonucleotidase
VIKTVFLDLDGCLVDFIGGACNLYGIDNPYDLPENLGKWEMYNMIPMKEDEFYRDMDYDFWRQLHWTEDGKDILDALEEMFGKRNICILSSPCRTDGCLQGKADWIRSEMPQYKRQFLLGNQKHFCAWDGASLVDDSDKNCDEFCAAGGEAILVPRPWNRNYKISGNTIWYVKDKIAYYRS